MVESGLIICLDIALQLLETFHLNRMICRFSGVSALFLFLFQRLNLKKQSQHYFFLGILLVLFSLNALGNSVLVFLLFITSFISFQDNFRLPSVSDWLGPSG